MGYGKLFPTVLARSSWCKLSSAESWLTLVFQRRRAEQLCEMMNVPWRHTVEAVPHQTYPPSIPKSDVKLSASIVSGMCASVV